MMRRRTAALVMALSACLGLTTGVAHADPDVAGGGHHFVPGAPGAGDPYFPLDGNGGYDVQHYRLEVTYDPATDVLTGKATITARATQDLSSFNLDFEGLTVRSITVDSRAATWTRDGGELTVTPRRGLVSDREFTTVVRYDGVPVEGDFRHTDDGALVLGEPDVAASWFPVNDHPIDKASYDIQVTVPQGLTAVSNGTLESRRTTDGWTTFHWRAREPMASYLAMLTIGRFDLHAYRQGGLQYWDALDPDLFEPVALPRTGARLALSNAASTTYKRLARTISVPAGGAQLSFWITRGTEPNWDFVFVEAHTAGQDNWTTLPDLNGHTSQGTGRACPFWLGLHPFLGHYQTDNGDGTCTSAGTSGQWWAASGASTGYEQWAVDLSAYAGIDVEVSISYASDDVVQGSGAFIDDIVVSTGQGSTSFEDDGDLLDGWTVPGAPAGSQPNRNDWFVGTAADVPPPVGPAVQASFARQGEIIDFLSSNFGPYPFSAAGGIVDDVEGLGFALENQTRPIYSKSFFDDQLRGDSVVVHELTHQWFGDSLTLERWQHIWLNEGFASYAEWLWSEREGLDTAQDIFDFFYARPATDPFWSTVVGDPGPERLFSGAIYNRGAMTLHMLRRTVGDNTFFRILQEYTRAQQNGNVNTDEFIAVAERVSGRQLDTLFHDWLFTATKPVLPAAATAAPTHATAHVPAVAKFVEARLAAGPM
jgi:Peptidase family M1 domain/Peptidase M1 N-terminal domain